MAPQRSKGALALNIIKTVFLGLIAVTLVKFAFFPGQSEDEQQPLDPSAAYGSITVLPELGNITNTINLEGTIQTDPAATVKATKTGEVTEIYVSDGQFVNAGETLLLIQKEVLPEASAVSPDDAAATPQRPQPSYENAWITAPTSGTVTLNALVSQMVNVGDTVASVQPPSYSAVANLTPDQMYRIQQLPDKATITIKNGPAPFECSGVKINTPQQRQSTDGERQGNTATAIEARCAIASEHKVFPGLQVTMALVAGQAENVLTVPLSAVEGRFETGIVYAPNPAGPEPLQLHVKLGLTDGKRIEIKEGLTTEQEILEFVPGKKLENQPGMPSFPGYYPEAGGDPATDGDASFEETGN